MMGFPQPEIERAWNGSDIKTTEGLIIWLENNPQPIQSQPIP